MTTVTGIVLAAGASERMGEPKLLLPYRGTTVLNATISGVVASAVDRVIVVTGARADEIEASLGIVISSSPSGGGGRGGAEVGGGQGGPRSYGSSPFPEGTGADGTHSNGDPSNIVVRNPDFRRGNMSSLLTGIDADPDADAFVLVPGDTPAVRTSVIDAMVALWQEEEPWAAVTAYRNRVAHPFLLSRTAVESMEEMTGEKVLGRILVESDDDRVARLSVPHQAPRDVNTPEDYAELLEES